MQLKEIIKNTHKRVSASKNILPIDSLVKMTQGRSSAPSFRQAISAQGISLIAETKKASPSAGVFMDDYDPVKLAKIYEASGAAAVSVLTEPSGFLGSKDHLRQVLSNCSLPVLQKDFFVDEYQVHEAKLAGASAILLIVAILTDTQTGLLLRIASDLGIDAVVEVHTEDELDRALDFSPEIIGINNRNLANFSVDLDTSKKLALKARSGGALIIAESGVRTRKDLLSFEEFGFDAVLVGTSIVKSPEPALKIKELLGVE